MQVEILKSQTGSGPSKRAISAISAVLALAMVVMQMMGRGDVSQEVANQTPLIGQGAEKVIEGGLVLVSAAMAIWSKWQDQR